MACSHDTSLVNISSPLICPKKQTGHHHSLCRCCFTFRSNGRFSWSQQPCCMYTCALLYEIFPLTHLCLPQVLQGQKFSLHIHFLSWRIHESQI